MKAVFDTNIIIDYLKGVSQSAHELDCFEDKAISIITYIEILVGIELEDKATLQKIKSFLNTFHVIMVNQDVADLAIAARKKYALKIPDAIIFATAQFFGALLITRNTKDFSPSNPLIRVPYQLSK